MGLQSCIHRVLLSCIPKGLLSCIPRGLLSKDVSACCPWLHLNSVDFVHPDRKSSEFSSQNLLSYPLTKLHSGCACMCVCRGGGWCLGRGRGDKADQFPIRMCVCVCVCGRGSLEGRGGGEDRVEGRARGDEDPSQSHLVENLGSQSVQSVFLPALLLHLPLLHLR